MIAGTCYVCGKPAFRTCLLCGKASCREHLDEKGFACRSCAPGAKKNRASKGPGDPGGVMG
ncbi:MAG: hypothetical protein MUC62_05755 [Candidatus Thermoplasmatota archaeon]|jgi:hypothetical protein|nr:hypothetical protein [Candidatus Thermoplasmatota archaeon]